MSFATDTDVLAPFEIWQVMLDDKTAIKFHEPLMLTPTRMPNDPDEWDDNEYLQIICPELEIDVCAESRDELLEWIRSDVRMNWKHFVSKDDSELNPQTLSIKRKYLSMAEVIDG
jgi:hypothetical protein